MCRSQPVQCTIWCGFDNRRNPIFSPLCRLYSDWNVWCSSGLRILRPIPKVWSDLIKNRGKSLRLIHVTFFEFFLSAFFYIIFIANTRTQDEKRQKQQEKKDNTEDGERWKGKTHEILFHLSSLCWFNIFHTAISPNTRFAMFNFRFDFLFSFFLLLFSPPPLCFPFELEDIFRSFLLRPLALRPRQAPHSLAIHPKMEKNREHINISKSISLFASHTLFPIFQFLCRRSFVVCRYRMGVERVVWVRWIFPREDTRKALPPTNWKVHFCLLSFGQQTAVEKIEISYTQRASGGGTGWESLGDGNGSKENYKINLLLHSNKQMLYLNK